MAMTAFEILGILTLDKANFDKSLKEAQSDAKTAGTAMSSGGKTLAAGVAAAAKIGVAAVGAATTAAVGFGKSAIDAAVSFEDAFTGVRKTVDATEEEYAQLESWIMDAATKMASSQEEIAGTMEIAGQLGISGVEGLEKFTETMIMLGDTTNLNAEEAAGALARFMNITGDSAENADKIGSVIVDLGNHFATTEQDIVNMSTRLASAGTVAGLSATDILALSTAMSSVGIQAEAGGTAMAQTIAKMSKSVDGGMAMMGEDFDKLTKDEQKMVNNLTSFADVAGMSAEQFAAVWNDKPIDAITAFIQGLHNINEADESVIMTLEDLGLKGIRQTNMLQALALASDMLGDSVTMANKAYKDNVALTNEANLRYGTTASQAEQTANSFKNLKKVIGEELMPVYSEFMSFSREIITSMQEGFEEGGMEGLMEAIGKGISDALNKVNEFLPEAIKMGMKLLGALAQGIMDNLDAIIDTGVQIIQQLIFAIVEALPQLVEGGLQIILGLAEGIIEMLPELVPAIVEVVIQIVQTLIDNIGLLVDAAIALVTALADGVIQSLPILIAALPQLVEAIVTGLMDNLPTLVTAVIEIQMALAQAIADSGPLLLDAVVQIWLMFFELTLEYGNQLLESVGEIFSQVIETITTWLQQAPEKAAYYSGLMVGKFITFITNLPQKIQEILTNVINAIISFGEKFISEGPKIAREFVSKLVDGFKSLPSKMVSIGKSIVSSIKEGIKGAWGGLKEWIMGLIDDFIQGIIDSLPGGGGDDDGDGDHGPQGSGGGGGNSSQSVPNGTPIFWPAGGSSGSAVGGYSVSSSTGAAYVQETNSEILSLLRDIRDNGTVVVNLEGDADRLFRVMQSKANSNYRVTGQRSLVTL